MNGKYGLLVSRITVTGLIVLFSFGCETESDSTGKDVVEFSTVLIPAGTFAMGSPAAEAERSSDEIQHTVTLSAFRMSKYEITTSQYADFLNTLGVGLDGIYADGEYPDKVLVHKHTNSYPSDIDFIDGKWAPVAGRENYPVRCVPWYGAAEFANYKGGRLPTEAEWEYACRAGATGPFGTGDCLSPAQANYNWNYPYGSCGNKNTNPPSDPQKVGSYAANAYGLYDMHGNVEEWCSDYYGAYPTTPQTNPTGSTKVGYCVIRGGTFADDARNCRAANRSYDSPGQLSNWHLGFRIVIMP